MTDRVGRAFDGLLRTLAWLAAGILSAIAVSIPTDLVLRSVFETSIYGLLDAIEYGLLAATFLAAPWVLSVNAHVSVDLVAHALKGRARRLLDALANVAAAGATSVFLWFSVAALLQSIERGTMIRTAFSIPEWWVLAVPPVAMALILAEFGRRLARGSGRPAGIEI